MNYSKIYTKRIPKHNGLIQFNLNQYSQIHANHELKDSIHIPELLTIYHAGYRIVPHNLLYKLVQEKKTNIQYVVIRVLKKFYAGWFYFAELQDSQGRTRYVNITYSDLDFDDYYYEKKTIYDDFVIIPMTIEQFYNNNVIWYINAYEPAIDRFHKQQELNSKVINWFSEKGYDN